MTDSKPTERAANTKGATKKTAAKKTATKNFIMPNVDLGGLGADDEDEAPPPLDLSRFARHDAASARESVGTGPRPSLAAEALHGTMAIEPQRGPAAGDPQAGADVSARIETNSAAQLPAQAINLPRDVGSTYEEATPVQSMRKLDSPSPVSPATRTAHAPDRVAASSPGVDNYANHEQAHSLPALRTESVPPSPARWSPAPPASTVPTRRPRRSVGRPFSASQSQTRREDRLGELVEKVPCYAALLQSFAMAQSGSATYHNRNIQLYGLTAQELADRITVDKAVMTAMDLPTPRFTAAHYIDAVLAQALHSLNPKGRSVEEMEKERDVVWALASQGLAYRNYISDDPAIASMSKPRSQNPLRTDVNQRYSRMMDILRTMPEVKTQPFEIVSACVANYVQGLQAEQPAFEELWNRNLETRFE